MMSDLPDPLDVPGWRALIHAADDRPARAELVRSWAAALGCVLGEGADPYIHPPDGIPPPIAGALWHHCLGAGLYLRPPPNGWPPSDRLPEWR
jgi:hypothetical protein